jgi:DNA-binding transcriptional regulator LsrR (DeoR family)
MDVIDLDKAAVEIARSHLLKGASLRELGRAYHTSPSTIQRRLIRWLAQDRFELNDRLSVRKTAAVTGFDDRTGERLARRTGIWRARVVEISGAEEACSRDYLEDPEGELARAAFRASDELHRCLGEVAGELLFASLRKNITIGLASGRGVGFAVEKVKDLVQKSPSWGRGFESAHLVSLCGGAHLGVCDSTNRRDFDADENVFALASLLRVPSRNVSYMTGPVSLGPGERPRRSGNRLGLDLALMGLGQLNTQHHYFREYNQLQLQALSGPIRDLIESQSRDPDRYGCIAEIVLRLYPVGSDALGAEYAEGIQETNKTILAVAPDMLRNAGEVVLVAGGIQKLAALRGVLFGRCSEAPIDKTNLTLVTDYWTAEQILKTV